VSCTGNVQVKNEVCSSNTTDRMRHNIRGVKLTPASRRRYKIGLPVEGLSANISDYLIDKKKDNTKCKIIPKLIQTFPINTNQLPCKWIDVST